MPTIERPSLPDLQRWMRWVLTHPDGAGDVIGRPHGEVTLPRNWTRGPEPERALHIIGQSKDVSQETRLSIYGAGYFLRIVGVMAANYACVRNVLGAHDFDDHVGRDYLVKYPSTHKCIDNVGNFMPAFLARHPIAKHFPFLPDLARIEWAYHESFYSDEAPMLDLQRLKTVPVEKWASAVVALDPSVRLLDLKYPVVQLWRDNGEWSHARYHSLKPKPNTALIYRRLDAQVRVAEETPGAIALVRAFQAGKTFGAALRAALRHGMNPERVMPLFQEWTELGIIRQVSFR